MLTAIPVSSILGPVPLPLSPVLFHPAPVQSHAMYLSAILFAIPHASLALVLASSSSSLDSLTICIALLVFSSSSLAGASSTGNAFGCFTTRIASEILSASIVILSGRWFGTLFVLITSKLVTKAAAAAFAKIRSGLVMFLPLSFLFHFGSLP